MRGLQGKTAIVTGGASGIGAAIVNRLEAEGTRTVVFDLKSEHPVDITKYEAVKKAVDAAGPVDILVNAAAEPGGFAAPPKLAEIGGEYFHAEMDIKVMGYLRCAREVVPGICTFTGGSGGAAKTALATSRRASAVLDELYQ